MRAALFICALVPRKEVQTGIYRPTETVGFYFGYHCLCELNFITFPSVFRAIIFACSIQIHGLSSTNRVLDFFTLFASEFHRTLHFFRSSLRFLCRTCIKFARFPFHFHPHCHFIFSCTQSFVRFDFFLWAISFELHG